MGGILSWNVSKCGRWECTLALTASSASSSFTWVELVRSQTTLRPSTPSWRIWSRNTTFSWRRTKSWETGWDCGERWPWCVRSPFSISAAFDSAFCVAPQLMQYEPSDGAAEWEEELDYLFMLQIFLSNPFYFIIFDVEWNLCFTSFSSAKGLFKGNKPLQTVMLF